MGLLKLLKKIKVCRQVYFEGTLQLYSFKGFKIEHENILLCQRLAHNLLSSTIKRKANNFLRGPDHDQEK